MIPGASDENRTRIASLEGWSSTVELHLRIARYFSTAGTRPLSFQLSSERKKEVGMRPVERWNPTIYIIPENKLFLASVFTLPQRIP